MDRTRLSSTSYPTIFTPALATNTWCCLFGGFLRKNPHRAKMLLVPRNFKIDHLLRAITCGANLRPQGTIFGLLMWALFLFLNSAAGWRSAFSRGVGSSTEKCFAIPSSAAHCRRCCNPMNLLQILASAFNALHFAKHRKKAKSQLERQRKPKKERGIQKFVWLETASRLSICT